MAQKKTVITTIVDDLDGKEIDEASAVLVTFGWHGAQYEMDLSKTNADKLEKFLVPYVEAARRVTPSRKSSRSSGTGTGSGRPKEELQAIRDWAAKNDHKVSARGRIPAPVQKAFDEAHQS